MPAEQPGAIHHLPAPVSSFVGREQELRALRRLLHEHRLVTLTGVGGIGKTRLAFAAATEERDRFADGVVLVELAALVRPDLVLPTIAKALALPLTTDRPPLEQLAGALQARHLLLLIDNCEHVLEACARIATLLLARCPRLTLLTTSREPLAIGGERVVRVPALGLPEPTLAVSLPQLLEYDALRLFVERAQAAEPAFHLTAQTLEAVREICRQLDGIPLALELAAGRVRGMGVHTIVARLDQRFRLLISGDRSALPRQQTLRAMIDWSYDLLSASEHVVLRRLAVFAGAFTLDAADRVCAGAYRDQNGPAPLTPESVLDHLVHLVNKSLVHFHQATGRYQLLEIIRLYSRERLTEAGELETVGQRHAAWYLQLAEAAAKQLAGPEQAVWGARLEAEHDNLRAALTWVLDAKQGGDAARLGLALWRFWHTHTYQHEGLHWLEQMLALDAATPLPSELRPQLFHALGVLAHSVSHFAQASAYQTEALRLWREANDRDGMAQALFELGWQQFYMMHLPQARAYADESVAFARAVGSQPALASGLHLWALSIIERDHGDTASAAPHADMNAAINALEEALAIWRAVGDIGNLAKTISLLARAEAKRGNPERAGSLLCSALRQLAQVGNYIDLQGSLVVMLNMALHASQQPQAAVHATQVAGVMVARSERLGGGSAWEAEPFQQGIEQLAAALGADRFTQAFEAGKQMTLTQLIELAEQIATLATRSASPSAPPAMHATLTARERDVLPLVAAGLTNAQIAQRLHISPRTVNAHLTSIYSKLGVSSRAGAIRYAVEHDLG